VRGYASWGFEEGAEVAPGRVVLKVLGGGNRYEVCLVWDESLFSLGVAKLLRPDQAEDEKARRDLSREVEALESLAHPALVRCFDAVLDGSRPHVIGPAADAWGLGATLFHAIAGEKPFPSGSGEEGTASPSSASRRASFPPASPTACAS
jgi:serine/threonine protein kinase